MNFEELITSQSSLRHQRFWRVDVQLIHVFRRCRLVDEDDSCYYPNHPIAIDYVNNILVCMSNVTFTYYWLARRCGIAGALEGELLSKLVIVILYWSVQLWIQNNSEKLQWPYLQAQLGKFGRLDESAAIGCTVALLEVHTSTWNMLRTEYGMTIEFKRFNLVARCSK